MKSQFDETLEVFRSASGMEVCIKVMRPGLIRESVLNERQVSWSLHASAFCLDVKRTQNEQCRTCDLREVPARCQRERRIFSHICHAGAGEVVIPLFSANALAAVVFAGQFRTSKKQPSELPLLKPAEHRKLIALCRMLGAYLAECMRMRSTTPPDSDAARADSIRTFLEQRLRESPTVSDLARHLGLSATRTTHVVRETTHHSFSELRDELRLRRACDLLQGTYYKVAHVAQECGFSTSQYFHRFFREATGVTPLAYRQRNRPNA